MPLSKQPDGSYAYEAGAGAFDPQGDVEREAARRGASPEEAARIGADVLGRGQTGLTNFFLGADPGVIYGMSPLKQEKKADGGGGGGGGGADKAALDVAIGYLNYKLALPTHNTPAPQSQSQKFF